MSLLKTEGGSGSCCSSHRTIGSMGKVHLTKNWGNDPI